MIIAHVHYGYYPAVGGLERVVQRIAEEQTKLGHEVHVITSTYEARGRPKNEIYNRVYVHRMRSWRFFYPDLTMPIELTKGLLRETDIVHVHSQNSLFGIRVARVARELGAKVVTHFMAVDALRSHPSIIKRIFGQALQLELTRRFIKISDVILVKSFKDLNVLRTKYGVSAIYVPDGIDREYLNELKDPKLFRVAYDVTWDDYVLYIGRLHPAKGPQVLIKALVHILKENRDIGVVFIGPGDQKWLKGLASKLGVKEHVLFTGKVDEKTKISAIDGALCVAIPSLYDYVEVFSLVLSEAWARGKPAIASAIGELPYRIRHGVNGLLVPPNNPKALANAVLKVKALDLRIEADLVTWDQVSKKLCDLYKSS